MSSDLQSLRSKEEQYYGIDSQFLTEGLRLVLLLPGFSLLFFFGAWAFSGDSPEWWLENLEPTVKFDFSTCLTLIASTISLGFCAGLYLHRHRVKLTRMVFRTEVNAAADAHRPVTSMHGYSSVDGLISRTMASHNTALWMGFLGTIIAIMVAYLDSDSSLGKRGLLASSSLITMAIGQHLSTRNHKFNMVTKDGLLSAYTPPLHPSTISLGFCAGLYLHRHRVKLTRMVFRTEVNAAAAAHRPVTSMHGYSSVDGLISRTMASHNTALWMGVFGTIIAIMVAYLDSDSSLGKRGLLASSSLITMAIGQHLSTRNHKFNMVTKDGLLSAYTPPLHPSTLEMPFNDMLRTQMDPLLRSQFDDFLLVFESHIRENVDREFAREKFLMLMSRRHKGSLDRSNTNLELTEILKDEGVHNILEHEVFNESLWDSLFVKSMDSYPAFYRLIDRLEQDLSIGRKPDMSDLLFDVDLENVVSERANLFCYLHNLSDQERQVVLRVQSPDFRPHDLSLRYNLKPGQNSWWSEEPVPLSEDGDNDQLGRMAGLMQDGTLAWQNLLPEKTGEASVSIRLENVDGDLLVGRQINVRVRPEFVNWFRNTSSLTSYLIGGLGLVSSILFQILAVLATA